jgi:hypothetical protein
VAGSKRAGRAIALLPQILPGCTIETRSAIMKIGVFSTFMSPLATPRMIRDFGRRAEDIGLDSIWMGEHVALFDKNTYGYPGAKDGRIPVPSGGGMLDVVATFGSWRPQRASCALVPVSHSYRSATRSTLPKRCVRSIG